MKQLGTLLMICIMLGLIASLMMSSCVSAGGGDVGVVIFARTEKTNWTTDIFTMNEDGTNQTNISDWSDMFDDTWGLFCSPNGEKIAFSGPINGYYDIYVMNADGTDIINLTNTNGQDETEPTWSPDGTKIAFTNFTAIYIMNSDGTGRYKLSHSGGYNEYTPEFPSWSPDGTKLVFADWKDSLATIFIHDFDTGVTSDIANGGSPAWSADGNKIAFSGGINLHELHVMNTDRSGGVTTLYSFSDVWNNFIRSVAWSPNSEKIAFDVENYNQDDLDIYVINADGTNFENITNTTGVDERYPAWLP
jgi:TolB protein